MARLLIVDDDTDILKLTQAVLSHEEHHVMTATDAIEAMDILHNHSIDLLISDANMPHYSGFELIQTIRNEEKFSTLPIAMLTGLREKKDIEKAIKVGVDDYIVKPIDPLILIQKINDILEKNPPKSHPQIEFPPNSSNGQGQMQVPVRLVSISEVAVNFIYSGELNPGDVMEIQCAFFLNELGEAPSPLKILSKEYHSDGWLYSSTYLGARESYLKKVRKWIFTHGQSRKAA